MSKKIERTKIQTSGQESVEDDENLYLTNHQADVFRATSREGKQLELLFFSEDEGLISSQDAIFPIGAVEAHFRSTDKNTEPSKVEFITCCGKRIEAKLTNLGNHTYQASEFTLAKVSFQFLVTFSDGDQLVLRALEAPLAS